MTEERIHPEKLTRATSVVREMVERLRVMGMSEFASQYQSVLDALESGDYATAYSVMKDSFINPLGWSHRGYPESEDEIELDQFRQEVATAVDEFRVFELYGMSKKKS